MLFLPLFLLLGSVAGRVLGASQSFRHVVRRYASVEPVTIVVPNKYKKLPVPSKDPWYRPPPGWETTSPGTVLSIREHAYQSPKGIPNYYDVFQVLYRTTDSHQKPSYAATTVFLPDTHRTCAETFRNISNPANCSSVLVSYQLPYDSSCFNTSPSYSLQDHEPYGDIEIMLRRGYFVSVPDYEGPRASYGANVLAGHAILDQFRALRTILGNYGFRTNSTQFALWGYSSGGSASAFAAELAAEYAPDVKLAGVVLGGIASNMTASLALVNRHDVSGLLVHTLLGLTMEYPEQRRFLDAQLKKEGPYNSSEFYLAQTLPGSDGLAQYMYQDIYEYFKNGSDDVFAPTMLLPMNDEGLMGLHGTPHMPVFVYQAVNDEMCPIKYVDPVIEKYCSNGANIWMQRNVRGNHNLEGTNGRQRGLNFLSDVIGGTRLTGRPEEGCRVEDGNWYQDPAVKFY